MTFIITFVIPPVPDTEIFVIPAALDEKSSKWLVLIKTLSLKYDAIVAPQLQWKSAIIQIIIVNSFNSPYNVFIMLIKCFKCCVFIIYACAFACILAVQDLRHCNVFWTFKLEHLRIPTDTNLVSFVYLCICAYP